MMHVAFPEQPPSTDAREPGTDVTMTAPLGSAIIALPQTIEDLLVVMSHKLEKASPEVREQLSRCFA